MIAAIPKEARELSKNTGMKPRVILPNNFGDLDHETEVALYRSAQEALHNIAKHSQAKSFVVRLEINHHAAMLVVEDDGIGFSRRETSRRSFGLLGMRERIAALGGTVRIRSRKDKGSRVTVTLPWAATAARHARADLLTGVSQFSAKYEGAVQASHHNVH